MFSISNIRHGVYSLVDLENVNDYHLGEYLGEFIGDEVRSLIEESQLNNIDLSVWSKMDKDPENCSYEITEEIEEYVCRIYRDILRTLDIINITEWPSRPNVKIIIRYVRGIHVIIYYHVTPRRDEKKRSEINET